MKTFVSDLADKFDIASGKVRIGTIRYSGGRYFGVHVVHALNRYSSAKDIKEAIRDMPYSAGRTATGL